jgi:2-polyprenyl-6-methoxyphenol hydroxylase-like FAD-dependent oxidoreductase
MTASSGPQFPTQTPVLIIGGGPVGLFSALSLARYGIPSTIVERQHTRTGQPKAHVLNSRSLEIFKQFGINTQTIRECAASPSDADVVRFVQSMTGVEYGNILYERQDEEIKQYTPEPLVNIEQPHIERILAEAVQDNELVSIWRGFQWQGCEKGIQGGEERIRSTILVRETGQEVVIESKYLLACDGAHSRARAALNIPVDTPRSPFPSEVLYVSVELKADWRKYKSGILWMIMLKNTMQTFIAYDRGSHWVFAFMIEPDTSESLFTEEYCREKVDLVCTIPLRVSQDHN